MVAFIGGAMLAPLAARGQWVTSPAWTIFAPSPDVSFAISTDGTTYSTRQIIVVRYRIMNVANRALYVPRNRQERCPTVEAHVMVWLEDPAGRYSASSSGMINTTKNGIGEFSCTGSEPRETLTERMSREAVLLAPGEHIDGNLLVSGPSGPALPNGLPTGGYRIEAILYGWTYEQFTEAEIAELAKMQHPFLRGETPASVAVTLTRW